MSGRVPTYGVVRGADSPGGGDVVVLDQGGVTEAHAMVDAASAADRVLLQRSHPWHRLAGVADLCGGAGDRVDPACGERGDSDSIPTRFTIVRSAVSSSRTGPSALSTTSPGDTRSPSPRWTRTRTSAPASAASTEKTVAPTSTPAEYAGGARHQQPRPADVWRDGGLGGDVRAQGQVLVQRGTDERDDGVGAPSRARRAAPAPVSEPGQRRCSRSGPYGGGSYRDAAVGPQGEVDAAGL
jgi:hypothetical protein